MDLRRISIIVTMDVLLLAELVLSIYLAGQDIGAFSATFFACFVPMSVVTVGSARWALSRLVSPIIVAEVFTPVGLIGHPVPTLAKDVHSANK
jgi:uncharacterized membrane protein